MRHPSVKKAGDAHDGRQARCRLTRGSGQVVRVAWGWLLGRVAEVRGVSGCDVVVRAGNEIPGRDDLKMKSRFSFFSENIAQ